MRITDKSYIDEHGVERTRVTEILSSLYDPGPAAITMVAKEANRLICLIENDEMDTRPVAIWSNGKYVWGQESHDPALLLQDLRHMTGAYWRAKQGWMDRGTLTGEFVDEYARNPMTSRDIPDWIHDKFECGKVIDEAAQPVPYKCDQEELELYLASALKWLTESGVEIQASQIYVQHSTWAGTADGVGTLRGKRAMLEYKTGHPSQSRIHQMQVCAYSRAFRKTAGLFTYPVVVYFTLEGYRECWITDRKRFTRMFDREVKRYEDTRNGTGWSIESSEKLEVGDFPIAV